MSAITIMQPQPWAPTYGVSVDGRSVAECSSLEAAQAAALLLGGASACGHPRTERGKDAPMRYGSKRTEVCLDCGAFRTHSHTDPLCWLSAWRPADEYAEATAESDDC